MIGKRVSVNVGVDNWGEVPVPNVPYLVTIENDKEYGLTPIHTDFSDMELVRRKIHRFLVDKDKVKLWGTESVNRLNRFDQDMIGGKVTDFQSGADFTTTVLEAGFIVKEFREEKLEVVTFRVMAEGSKSKEPISKEEVPYYIAEVEKNENL